MQKHIKAPKEKKKMADKRSTIDVEDIARFDALATEWWDPRGAMRPLLRLSVQRHPHQPQDLQHICHAAWLGWSGLVLRLT